MGIPKKISDNEINYLYLKDKNTVKLPLLPLTTLTEYPFDDIFENDYKIVVNQYYVKRVISNFIKANVFELLHIESIQLQEDRTVVLIFARGNSQTLDWDKKIRKSPHEPYLKSKKKKKELIEEYIDEGVA